MGNDAVHIVWTENKRDYDPKTITSQFNDVHIVVYPMPNGLYRVQVFKKQQVRHHRTHRTRTRTHFTRLMVGWWV